MRYITISILTVTFLSLSTNAYAQKSEKTSKMPEVQRTFVSFEVQSIMILPKNETMQLPVELISYFNNQNSLATLQVSMGLGSDNDRAIINASYVFPSLKAYRQWRKKSETKNFVQFLQDHNKNQNLNMALTMRRLPLDELVEYNNQN